MEPFRNTIPEMFDARRGNGHPLLWRAVFVFDLGCQGRSRTAWCITRATMARPIWTPGTRSTSAGMDAATAGLACAMSPHATDTCGPDPLRACAARARELDIPITTHLAQSQAEVATIGSRHGGRTPAEYLDWLGLLAPDLMAAHCIASTDGDLKLMAAKGATGAELPARVCALRALPRRSAGSCGARRPDGGRNRRPLTWTCSAELNAASMISKIASARADVANAPELIESVTATAAAVIKRPDLGTIAPGATADLTVVDLTHPHLQPLFDPRRGLVALGNRANIDQVIVDGRRADRRRPIHSRRRDRDNVGRNGGDRQESGICRKPRRPSMVDGSSVHALPWIGEAPSRCFLHIRRLTMPFDLILRGGRVIDPSQKLGRRDGCRLRRRQGGHGRKRAQGRSRQPMCATCRVTSSPRV